MNIWLVSPRPKGEKQDLDLLHFRVRIADALLSVGKTVDSGRKRGRPRDSETNPATPTQPGHSSWEKRPNRKMALDAVDHLPIFEEAKNNSRC